MFCSVLYLKLDGYNRRVQAKHFQTVRRSGFGLRDARTGKAIYDSFQGKLVRPCFERLGDLPDSAALFEMQHRLRGIPGMSDSEGVYVLRLDRIGELVGVGGRLFIFLLTSPPV